MLKSPRKQPFPENPATLGEHLLKRRHTLGLSQKQAAATLGVCAWTLLNWEQQRHTPALRFWPRLIAFLGVDPLAGSDHPHEALHAHRLALGLSRRQLAAQLGCDPDTLGRWERGQGRPTGAHAERLARFMGWPAARSG